MKLLHGTQVESGSPVSDSDHHIFFSSCTHVTPVSSLYFMFFEVHSSGGQPRQNSDTTALWAPDRVGLTRSCTASMQSPGSSQPGKPASETDREHPRCRGGNRKALRSDFIGPQSRKCGHDLKTGEHCQASFPCLYKITFFFFWKLFKVQ